LYDGGGIFGSIKVVEEDQYASNGNSADREVNVKTPSPSKAIRKYTSK